MTMKKENKENEEIIPSGITRKDAIKKMGKYATLTAMGTFMILNPKKAQAQSASGGEVMIVMIVMTRVILHLQQVGGISKNLFKNLND